MLEAARRNAAWTLSFFSASDWSVRTWSPRARATARSSASVSRFRPVARTRALVVDKKLHYSNRAGGGSYVEYVYSDTETTSRIRLYRWSDMINDWEEIDASAFGEAPSR